MAIQLKKDDYYTIDDIYRLPAGKRAELINGEIYMMAPPSSVHQMRSMELSTQIYNYIKSKNGKYKVFAAPFAVFINNDNKNYVEPDISVICDKDKIDNKGCYGAPDWLIEIVSPASKRMDYLIKSHIYMTAGVREYWIVDYDKQRITVHCFEKESIEEYSFRDIVKANIYDDLSIDFGTLIN